MSAPTGMSFATGQHYQHVIDQMNVYANNHGTPQYHVPHGHAPFAPPFAHQPFGNGPFQNDVAGRTMMRNLFSH